MPKITPKSPETVQAQIAAFTAERIKDYRDEDHIYKNIGSLALGGMGDVVRVTSSAEYQKDENGKGVRIPEGTQKDVATAEEYTDFLRSVGGANYESIKGRADLLNAYGRFEPVVTALRDELADPATRDGHPNFLGSGSNAMVFSIATADKEYAVRVPRGRAIDPAVIDSHLGGAVLGRGVPHLEQIVAASYIDGVTVAEMMPGKEVGDLTVDEIAQVTDEQLAELVDTLMVAHERGIEIDPKPSNVFYDVESGYGIVDYHSSYKAGKNSKDQKLGEVVGWMDAAITNAGLYGKPYKRRKDAEDYAHETAFMQANFGVLKRYRAVVENKLAGNDQREALRQIDDEIQKLQGIEKIVITPEWIEAQLVRDQEERERRRQDWLNRSQVDSQNDFV